MKEFDPDCIKPSGGSSPRGVNEFLTILRLVLASVAGATAWLLGWLVSDLLLRLTRGKTVPFLKSTVLGAVIAATLTGVAVGIVVVRSFGRCDGKSLLAAAGCAVAAILLGEYLYVLWTVYRESETISFSIAFRVLARFWSELHWYYVLQRTAAMIGTVCFAVLIVQMKRRLPPRLTPSET